MQMAPHWCGNAKCRYGEDGPENQDVAHVRHCHLPSGQEDFVFYDNFCSTVSAGTARSVRWMQRYARSCGRPEVQLALQPDYIDILTGITQVSHRYIGSYGFRALVYWSNAFFLRYLLDSWHDEVECSLDRVTAASNKRRKATTDKLYRSSNGRKVSTVL